MHTALIVDLNSYQFEKRLNDVIKKLEENGYSVFDIKFQQSIRSDSTGYVLFFSALILYH